MSTAPQTPTSSKPSPWPWLIIIGVALAWGVYITFFGPKTRVANLAQPLLQPPMRAKAAYNWAVNDLDGKPFDFASLRGKVVFLNLWATWCPPCVAELPSIDQLASNARLRDVSVVCVAVNDSPEAVREFVSENKPGMLVLFATEPPPAPFRTQGIPATFVLDREGNIVVHEVGAARWDDPKVVDFLADLAKE